MGPFLGQPMSGRRISLVLAGVAMVPQVLLLAFFVVPSVIRGDFNPVHQLELVIVVVGLAAVALLIRQIQVEPESALLEHSEGRVKVSSRFVLTLLAAVVATIGVIWTLLAYLVG